MYKAENGLKSVTTLVREGYAKGLTRTQIAKMIDQYMIDNNVTRAKTRYQHVKNTEDRLGLKRNKEFAP